MIFRGSLLKEVMRVGKKEKKVSLCLFSRKKNLCSLRDSISKKTLDIFLSCFLVG